MSAFSCYLRARGDFQSRVKRKKRTNTQKQREEVKKDQRKEAEEADKEREDGEAVKRPTRGGNF